MLIKSYYHPQVQWNAAHTLWNYYYKMNEATGDSGKAEPPEKKYLLSYKIFTRTSSPEAQSG